MRIRVSSFSEESKRNSKVEKGAYLLIKSKINDNNDICTKYMNPTKTLIKQREVDQSLRYKK